MKQNLLFPDGKLAVKSINEVYADSNGNVTVDHVATADAIGSTTATQVADTVNKAHTHDNKTTLDKLADASGKLTYNGSEIGGTVDESRLLPANPSDYDLAIYRVFPEEAAPQNLTSATSDPNWEVTWSGAYSGRVGWQAFDSDQLTTWCTYSAAVGDWLCWEYKGTEGSVLLRRYSIAKGSGNGDCPTGWKIQGSNDGSTWVDLDEQTGQSFPDNNAKEYTIPNNPTPYKFHRFYLLSWNTSNMIGTFKAWSWINSTEEREVWIPINKSEFVVNEARLLPTGGRNGNLLEYQEGVDRGNNVNTKLLLQPATSDGLIVDQAVGNAAPVDITNSGNVLIEDNALVFTGTNSLLIPANALGMTLGGNNEFTIDIEFQLDSVKSDYATLYGSDGGSSSSRGALYFTSGGAAHFTDSLGPSTTGWTPGTKHRITIERWNDNGTWKTSVYRNGSFLASSTSGMNTLSDYVFPIGSNTDSTNRNFIGKIWAFRISNKAEHHGVSFAPQELPFLPPAGQPVWTEGIDRSRLLPENPANGDIPCFDATATIGGGNNENTKILLHFDTEIKDEAAGNAAPVTIITKSGTITIVDGGKFGKCAKFVTGSMTVATNLDELNANNWVVSGWFNPDADKHGVSYPTWLSMDDQNTHGFGFDSTGRYGESDAPLFYMDTPPTAGEWHWLAIVKYSGGLRFYLNGAFLNEIVSSQMANFCSTLAIGGFAGTYAAGSTERTFSGLVDEVRLQYIPEDEISKWTGTSIAVPTEPYTVTQIVGEWNTINKTSLVNSINGITPDDTGNVTLDLLTEEQISKLNSIVLANDFTFTQSDIVSNMITKNATTLGVPAGSMVQVLSNTGIVMTERAGILVYWSGNNLIIDFTGYFNTTQTTLTGTWTVKFAGNFVGSGSGGSGTIAAIAYPIVLVKPAYTEAIHLEMVYATQDDYSDAQTLVNTKTTSADRSLVKAFGGTAWETCPSGGFGSVYDKQPVKIIVSSKLDATTIYNIKYRWISASSDTSISEWYGMVYPCYSVSQ